MHPVEQLPERLTLVDETGERDAPWRVDCAALEAELPVELCSIPVIWAGERAGIPISAARASIKNDGREPSGDSVIGLACAPTELEEAALWIESLTRGSSAADLTVLCIDMHVPGWEQSADPIEIGEHRITIHQPGLHRGAFDDRHLVIIAGPRYDGFATCELTAHRHVGSYVISPDESLAPFLAPKFALIPLHRGQSRGVDLELEPDVLPKQGVSGWLYAYDENDHEFAAMRVTLIGHSGVECLVSGSERGPITDPLLSQAVDRLVSGERSAWRFVAALDRAEQRENTQRLTGIRKVLGTVNAPMMWLSDRMWQP